VVFDRITFDPKILAGRACIRGLRIPAMEYAEYAAWLTHEEVHPASR